jgi:sugar (pentulose or hexulose) kinase
MKEHVIVVFDIGKTNKKLLLFNPDLKVVYEVEEKFATTKDDDGFECDNIELIEKWIRETVLDLINSEKYELDGINFTTYGATLVYLDAQGRRLTPVYNYLKPIDESIPELLYKKYGGKDEFCRRTASPALGMLNSGNQALWLKTVKPVIFSKVKHILHFPQYLSYLITGKIFSEHTSIGCHTALWDFDNMSYHPWVTEEGLKVPNPVSADTITEVVLNGKKVKVGIGLHDSSASLVPYFASKGGKFLLISTGTWCINMNPFNREKLTSDQLSRDCLCYLSIAKQPVKASRLFMGHMHDTAVKMMSDYFKIHENSFSLIKPDLRLLNKLRTMFENDTIFMGNGNHSNLLKEDADLFGFDNFVEGYHQLMVELSDLAVDSINLIIPEDDDTSNIFITGGFSKNLLFLKMIASSFPEKKIFTSEISNASALGAASIISGSVVGKKSPIPDLGLIEVEL